MQFFVRSIAAIAAAAALTAACSQEPDTVIGGAFELTAHTGERVTDRDFRGRPMLVFFGFTYCPDVCPLSLQKVTAAFQILGDDAAQFQTVLVSVDPQRDTPEAMARYVASHGFPPGLVGLTGTEEEIRAVADLYRVYYKRIEDDESAADYLMEHTAIIYLMDADGRFVKPLTHDMTPTDMTSTLRAFLDGGA